MASSGYVSYLLWVLDIFPTWFRFMLAIMVIFALAVKSYFGRQQTQDDVEGRLTMKHYMHRMPNFAE